MKILASKSRMKKDVKNKIDCEVVPSNVDEDRKRTCWRKSFRNFKKFSELKSNKCVRNPNN